MADKATKASFPRAQQMAERVANAAYERGLLVTAGIGCANGRDGDAIALAPPFIISDTEIDEIVEILEAALNAASQQ